MEQQNSRENSAEQAEPGLTEDTQALEKALEEERTKAEANLAGWQRERADFINYKRRIEQEREEFAKSAAAGLMLRLLPILDDLDRAFTFIPAELAGLSWVEGMKAIDRKLRSALQAQGLAEIQALGQPFDPNSHEAVMEGKGKEGVVVAEVQKGYKLYDKVLRPTKAVVGSGEEEKGG